MRHHLLALPLAALALAGCAGSATATASSASSTGAATTATTSASSSTPAELGTIEDSGFGQKGEYLWASAVVHNNSKTVGQTVTVTFNALDAQGNILKTESQVEAFTQPEADHILGTQLGVAPGEKVAKVEATLDVEDQGTFSDQAFPTVPTSTVKIYEDYGQFMAAFDLTNPLTEPLKSPRIQLACHDAKGAIIGGGMDYPEAIAAGKKIRVNAHLTVSAKPADCAVFVSAPTGWDGEGLPTAGTTPTAGAPAAASDTPENAFKIWVEQFKAKDWTAHYATLVNAQREKITGAEYIACRKGDQAPEFTWSKVLKSAKTKLTIPGTSEKVDAVKVTAQLKVNGLKVPVDAHMINEDGAWKWSMTAENVAKCGH